MRPTTTLLLAVLLCAPLLAAEPLRLADPIPKIEALENPCRYVSPARGCVVRDPKGDVHVMVPYNSRWRGPMQLGDFNLTTGATRLTEMDTTARPSGGLALLGDLLLVGAGGAYPGDFYLYNMLTGEAGPRLAYSNAFDYGAQSTVIGDDGAVYLGGGSQGMVGRFDPTRDDIIDVFPIREKALTGSPYVYSMGADRRWLYCEIGQMPWYLMIHDRLTDQRTVHFMGQFGFVLRGKDDGKLYYQFTSGKEKGKLFRLQRGKPVLIPPEEAKGIALNPRWLKSNVYPDHLADQGDFGFEIQLKDTFPTAWNNGSSSVHYRPKGEEAWRELSMEGIKLYPRTIKRMAWLPDGNLIGFGDMYGPVFRYNPETQANSQIGPPYGNTYGLVVDDPFVYMTGYATLSSIYDLRKPWHQDKAVKPITNPASMAMPGHVTGTYLVKAGDGKLYGVWKHARRSTGAHLAVWDPATRKGAVVVRHEDRIYRDLAAVGDGRYLVMPAQKTGSDAPTVIITYDTQTGKATVGPDLPTNGWAKLAPCGKTEAFGVSPDGWLFRVDVVKGEMVYQKQLPEETKPFGRGHQWDWEIAVGPDGWVWLAMNQNELCRINPADGAVQKIGDMPVSADTVYHTRLLFRGRDLYLYGEHLSRLRGLFK